MSRATWLPSKRPAGRPADFNELLKVLRRETPSRPTLFEFFLNESLYDDLAGADGEPFRVDDPDLRAGIILPGFYHAGYDHVTLHASNFFFPQEKREHEKSISMSHGGVITTRAEFEQYQWPQAQNFSYARLDKLRPYLREGQQFIIYSPGGVLENVTALVGYEDLCFMINDDEELATEIFNRVGSCLYEYYELALQHDGIGAVICNDDWGFNSQTMLPPEQLRQYVFPWHQKIAALAHARGKPALLHSCGLMREIWDDIIDVMKFDAKHSFEDKIQPVEDAYNELRERIAILGGIDLNYVCTKTPAEVYQRSRTIVEHARAGYALGTGNSIPAYVPRENYFAMIDAALI